MPTYGFKPDGEAVGVFRLLLPLLGLGVRLLPPSPLADVGLLPDRVCGLSDIPPINIMECENNLKKSLTSHIQIMDYYSTEIILHFISKGKSNCYRLW